MDASFELIKAALDHLKATAAVNDLVGGRFFDRVPEQQDGVTDVQFPYVSLGSTSAIPADFDCLNGEEVTFQLDIWTSGDGVAYSTVQCRQICGAIKRALHHAELTLTTNALVTLEHEITRVLDDPQPAVSHGVVQFTATVETP